MIIQRLSEAEAGELDNLFLDHDAWYDPDTPENASLYLLRPRASDAGLDGFVARLVEAGLWRAGTKSVVREDQRAIYARELDVLEVVRLDDAGTLAGRFDHAKFRSSPLQWAAWLRCLSAG